MLLFLLKYMSSASASAEIGDRVEFIHRKTISRATFWASLGRPLGGNFDTIFATECTASEP